MTTLPAVIAPEELPRFVPGKTLIASDHLGWRGVMCRSYRYTGLDVEVPPIRDFMVVNYHEGLTPMERRFDGKWSQVECIPGDVSLLTRGEKSHWHWTRDIDVVHVYLTRELVAKVSAEALDRDVVDVRLHDVLKAHDRKLESAASMIADEAAANGLGGALLAEAVATQMAVHLIRNYSSVSCREPHGGGALSPRTARSIADYVDARLGETISLDDLAALAGVSSWHFLRQFKARFGVAPHGYLIERRITRARELLHKSELPLKAIAATCGFSDQAHMTRLFRRHVGITPAAVRSSMH
jgi:AraC family transcriptional regulator